MAEGTATTASAARQAPRSPGGDGPSPPLPSDDKRWRIVAAVLRRYGHGSHALIEGMHATQQSFGCLEPAGLRYLAESLGLPLSRVYGVATFYHLFTLKPPGAHTCVVCTGTACHLKGARALLAALARTHGVQPGGTSPGGELSLLVARCLGACSLAPAVVLDGEMVGRVENEAVLARVASWFQAPGPEPSR